MMMRVMRKRKRKRKWIHEAGLCVMVMLLVVLSSPCISSAQQELNQDQEMVVAEKDGVELVAVDGTGTNGNEPATNAGVVGDKVDLIEVQRQQLEKQNNVTITVASQELSEEKMLQALTDFEQDVALGLISPDVLPDTANGTLVYQPPLESLLTQSTSGQVTDPTTQTLLVIYETLFNSTFYGLDDVMDEIAYIVGFPNFDSDFILGLATNAPNISEAVVRTWQTDLVVDVFQEMKQKLNEQGVERYKEAFAEISDQSVSEEEREEKLVQLIIDIAVAILKDPTAVLWEDLSVVLGSPLGPTLIPALESSLVTSAVNDTEGIKQRALDRSDALVDALEVLAGQTILFNPFFPSLCLKGSLAARVDCPENFQNTTAGQQFASLYEEVEDGSVDKIDYNEGVKQEFLRLFLSELGLKDMYELVEMALNSPSTSTILEVLSEWGDVNNDEVFFLQNLSIGNLTISTDPSSMNVQAYHNSSEASHPLKDFHLLPEEKRRHLFSPEAMVCLANVSALMYEYPDTKSNWTQGLGLKGGGEFTEAGYLSSIAQVFLDVESNAMILAFEGTPYMQTNFFRGLYGWLQDLLSSEQIPFEYPCDDGDGIEATGNVSQADVEEAQQMCKSLASKYPNAQAYRGFLPKQGDGQIRDEILGALNEALSELKEQVGTEEKPRLYITGHSLGAALAKSTLVQLLLRGYDLNFSEVKAYTFAPPAVGDEEYIKMIDELLETKESDLFMVINHYDYIPYLPPFVNFTHGLQTLFLDHDQALLKAVDLKTLPFENQPRNVFLPPLGYHSIKGQYLPLARAVVGNSYTEEMASSVDSRCELDCDVGQCGLFKCPDLCKGKL